LAFPRRTFPDPVTLKRLLAPECIFIFGIALRPLSILVKHGFGSRASVVVLR
jgi:hypothetical protein